MRTNGEEVQNLWQDHSDRFLEMALRTDRMEILENPDGHGKKTGECGDSVEFFILTDTNGTISRVSFLVNGCLNTVACANAVCELVEGKPLGEAWDLTPEQVIEFLESLPQREYHCAELAVGALYLGIADVERKKREPWKKLYGRNADSR